MAWCNNKRRGFRLTLMLVAVTHMSGMAAAQGNSEGDMRTAVDPVTRYIHIAYTPPADAPDELLVLCRWSPRGAAAWHPAKVMPLLSETGMNLVRDEEWGAWVEHGRLTERRAAGLERTAIFNPYPEAQLDGRVDVDFRVEIQDAAGRTLATHETQVQTDNSDVVYVEDWSQVLQHGAVSPEHEPGSARWTWRTGLAPEEHATFGNMLSGDAGTDTPLPQLSYPLDLRGHYAVFVCVPGCIELRFTGDERFDGLSSRAYEEVLWRWAPMDRQHLVLKQPYGYTGCAAGTIDYVKFVPLSEEALARLDAPFAGKRDKLVAGYWEPYSWAFGSNVQQTYQHREPLSAFRDAQFGIVDTQVNRFGMKCVYESRVTDQLLYATQGDPIGTVEHPETDNVGRMQQFTNTLDATLRYAKEFGFQAHANFGASNCYPGSPLQGDFSKAHPEWMRGSALRYEVPEVRAYVLSLYREALEIGTPGISIDFCRYPETIDAIATGNTIMRELRTLADEFSAERGERLPILVRFPGNGVRRYELFDYQTWAKEGWVDYLCPSNIQGRHLHIDIAPYQEAVDGTSCVLLPALDGLAWGQPLPGPFLWRTAQLYEAGVAGIYIYQSDARVLGKPGDRRCMRLLSSGEAVRQWWEEHKRLCPHCSKGIYITPTLRVEGYCGWQRIRVWTEGLEPGVVEFYIDDAFTNRCDGPPYLLGEEDYDTDRVIPPGDHELRIRARDGTGWLEQTFAIHGAE